MDAYTVDAQEIKCERAGVIQVVPADIKVALDLDEYITSLGQVGNDEKSGGQAKSGGTSTAHNGTASARALASYIGMDLQVSICVK